MTDLTKKTEHQGKFVIAVFGQTHSPQVEIYDTYDDAIKAGQDLIESRESAFFGRGNTNTFVVAEIRNGFDFETDF